MALHAALPVDHDTDAGAPTAPRRVEKQRRPVQVPAVSGLLGEAQFELCRADEHAGTCPAQNQPRGEICDTQPGVLSEVGVFRFW